MSKDGKILPVILSGGAGTRLWPLRWPHLSEQVKPNYKWNPA